MGMTPEQIAKQVIDISVSKIVDYIIPMIKEYKLSKNRIVVIGGGGGASVLVPMVAKKLNFEYKKADYDVDISLEEYQDKFEGVQEQKLKDAMMRELRNLVDKKIIKLEQPLFDVEQEDGSRNWVYSGDIVLGKYEFPLLGDVVIERRV